MNISGSGSAPVQPQTANMHVPSHQADKPQTNDGASANSNGSASTTGAQPLNSSGRGQVVNILV